MIQKAQFSIVGLPDALTTCTTCYIKFIHTIPVEIICTKHAYVLDPPDLTLFNFMQDIESFHLLISCGKLIANTCEA